MTKWLPTDADDETAARIREEYQQIAAHLGANAPEPDEPVSVAITAVGEIHFSTRTAMFALAPSGVAVCYRPLAGGGEEACSWKDGEKIRHTYNPPPSESN